MPTYLFHVLLLDAKGQPFPNLTVQIFEKDPTAAGPLEQGLSGSDGLISFSITANRFKNPAAIPQVYFKVLQDGKEIHKSGIYTVANISGEEQNITLTVPVEAPAGNLPYVHGRLEGADGEPLAGVKIVAYHQDKCETYELGEAKTNATGYYKIEYRENWRQAFPWLNLYIRAFVTEEFATWITSPIVANARPVEEINLAAGGGVYRGPSRFTTLQETLAPVAQCWDIRTMPAEMIAVMARESDVECTEVVHFFGALALKEDTGAEPELFYAFQKAGLSSHLAELIQQDKNTLANALTDAAKENLVPFSFAGRAADLVQTLRATPVWTGLDKSSGEAFAKYFHRKLGDPASLGPAEQTHLHNKLGRHFNHLICQALGAEDPVTLYAVAALKLDPLAQKDRDFMTVVRENVLAPLQQSNLLSGCNRKILVSAESLTGDGRTVGEVLGLGQALKTHPAFHREALHVKVRTLAGLAGLSPAATGQLADENLYLDLMPDTQWDDLVQKGILNAEQKFDLQKLYTFGKLTDFHFDLVKVIRDDSRIKTGKDLASLTVGDWMALLTKAGNSTPNGETPAVYIKNVMAAVEASYPAPAFYEPTLKRGFIKLDSSLAAIKPLLDKNENLLTGNAIDWSAVPDKDRTTVEQNLKSLKAFANAYRHLGVPEILESRQSVKAKGEAVVEAVRSLQRLIDQNPDMDIRTANFIKKSSIATPGEVNWSTVPAQYRDKVQRQMLAFQRVRNLAPNTEQATALLDMGADSAHKITAMPKNRFVQESGLEPAAAEAVYSNAQHAATVAMHHFQAAREVFQNQLMGLPVDNTIEHAHRGYLLDKNLQSGECEGPAYSHGNSLYSQLRNELLHVSGFEDLFGPQNFCQCDHCKSVLSPAAYFVDMMYWIEKHITSYSSAETTLLQQHCENKFPDHPLWLHNRRPDLWDLKVTCENTYELVPYLQIVNEVLEAYIKNLTGWTDIYAEVMKPANQISFYSPRSLPFYEILILLEHFEVRLPDIAKANRAAPHIQEMAWLQVQLEELNYAGSIFKKFGNKTAFTNMKVSEFLKHTKITRRELDALLAANYINKNQTIKIEKKAFDPAIQYYEEELVNLTAEALLRIHFFLKLRSKTPWSIPELDLVFSTLDALLGPPALGANPYQPNQITAIVSLLKIQEQLGVSLEEVVGIVHLLPNASLDSVEKKDPLTQELFQEKVPGYLTRKFRLDKMLGANTLVKVNLAVDKDKEPFTFFLAGLNISRYEFEGMQTWKPTGASLFNAATLNLDKQMPTEISLYFRHIWLAKRLKLSLPEWEKVLRLTQLLPDSISNTLALVERAMELKESPFTLDELLLLTDTSGNTPAVDKAGLLVGLHRTETPGFTGDILKAIHGTVFSVNKNRTLLDQLEFADQITLDISTRLYHVTPLFNWNQVEATIKPFLTLLQWQQHGEAIKHALNPYHSLMPVAGLYISNEKMMEIGDLEAAEVMLLVNKLSNAGHLSPTPDKNWFRVLDSYNATVLDQAISSISTGGINSKNIPLKQRLTDSMASIDQVLSATMLKAQYLKVWTTFTGMSTEQTEALLPMVENDWLSNYLSNFCQETVNGVPKGFEALWRQMQRLKIVVEKLQLSAADLQMLAQNHVGIFGISDIKSSKLLTLPNLAILEDYYLWKMLDPEAVDTVLLPALSNTQADKASVQAAFLHYFDIPNPVTGSVFFGFAAGQSNLDALQMLRDKALLCHRLGLSGTQLTRFITLTYAEAKGLSAALLASFQTQYDTPEAFGKAFDPWQERLNELKCELLRDYILARVKDVNFQTTNDLYAYFLLDTEMGGCLKISRIVAAHMSIQLYVHRVLMRLEQSENGRFNAVLDPDAADEWPWRKNYRVWEANRKVFLYPENYLEPEWRDNKSPEFKQLEEELLQQKISIESAEGAYKEYLKKFSEVGRLAIAGVYYDDVSSALPVYHIFGRSNTDPYIYYYRKHRQVGPSAWDWSPWEKVELAISAPKVSSIYFQGKLFLFWITVLDQKLEKFDNGSSYFNYYDINVSLNYSYLNEKGKWIQPQKIERLDDGFNALTKIQHIDVPAKDVFIINENKSKTDYEYYKSSHLKAKCYPYLKEKTIGNIKYQTLRFGYLRESKYEPSGLLGRNFDLNLYKNQAIWGWGGSTYNPNKLSQMVTNVRDNNGEVFIALSTEFLEADGLVDYTLKEKEKAAEKLLFPLTTKVKERLYMLLDVVYHKPGDFILSIGEQNLLIKNKNNKAYQANSFRLNTSMPDYFTKVLYEGNEGLTTFLSIDVQMKAEDSLPIAFLRPGILSAPDEPTDSLAFNGPSGLYFWELFFHIPSLIADHLNAEGKYKDADWWYRRIFNPTAAKDDYLTNPVDRNWQFVPFRNQAYPKYSDMLADGAALSVYNNDPFNPHAIARLRVSAYAKATVLRYVDNLLDWADKLYRQDTFESNNEAMMLYILAQDILGERPREAGKCETAADSGVTYGDLRPSLKEGSEFLIWMENLPYVHAGANTIPATNLASGYAQAQPYTPAAPAPAGGSKYQARPTYVDNKILGVSSAKNQKLVFCVPMNKEILDLWDRVEDRLFKLRHCMNIDGVRRTLSLFSPAIDPRMLIAARAAGLSLEEALDLLDSPIPYYRFQYMLDRAKSFAGTVQSFGGALLSAMEKKDVEELTLLRSVHEQNILNLTREIKRQQIEEAKTQLANLQESMKNIEIRKEYYAGLIETGLIAWERTQQITKHSATVLTTTETVLRLTAGITYLVPQVGSPPALKYGGKEGGDSQMAFSEFIGALSRISDSISASAGLEAGNQRREQEWKNQLKLAEQELKAMEKQIAAAEIRVTITEKDLMVHDTQIEQAKEMHEFYKSKFSNLGLYRFMATTLNRLFSQAYNLAYDMAKKAEKCYQFETEDATTFFIQGDNWDSGYAGLLAGERLLLQLQRMEKSFIEQTPRRDEIRQSFSVRMVNPAALITLRETGQCNFIIPEAAFDISYPGHYKRRIKSVSVTVPAVVGPYTNVPARLSLLSSEIRTSVGTNSELFSGPNFAHTSIAASSANNDGGQFELSFQDVRYLPFEGGGAANSKWSLELPNTVKPFDYNTISDVIIHINYTALYDSGLRTFVENGLKTKINGLTESFLTRVVSVKQEFPDVWHQLNSASAATLEIKKNLFPYFAQGDTLTLVDVAYRKDKTTWLPLDTTPAKPTSLEASLLLVHDIKNKISYVFDDDVVLLLSYTI